MRTPTEEQRAVLESTARIRLVRASPGSGKTTLVGMLLRRELGDSPVDARGIAALSFTRVAGQEIRGELDHDVEHPHFVGTIDSFLFRYVVRPFLQRCYPDYKQPRLIPGDWGADHWSRYGPSHSARVRNGKINLFGCVFLGEEEGGRAIIAHKPHALQPLSMLSGSDLEAVRDGKKSLWKRSGLLTHSDAAFWASVLLSHSTYGAVIRAEVVRRFNLLIIDELQDTGYFLGKSIRLLLEDSSVRGVLVGDPSQAIYEFNGARPALFETFEQLPDVTLLPLSSSHRCPSSVVNVARHLQECDDAFVSAAQADGGATLVHYADMVSDVTRLAQAIQHARPHCLVKIVARSNATVSEFHSGARPREIQSLRCPALSHMARAVQAFRQGRNHAALARSNSAFEHAVFRHEGVDNGRLIEAGIDPAEWKALAVSGLLKCDAIDSSLSMEDWQARAGSYMDAALSRIVTSSTVQYTPGKLKPQHLKKKRSQAGADTEFIAFAPKVAATDCGGPRINVQTVHAVKGETHDVTIFVCPDPASITRCPSSQWWDDGDLEREERRIAYVAATRARSDLFLCVSSGSFERLCADRNDFVTDCECRSIDECVAAYSTVPSV